MAPFALTWLWMTDGAGLGQHGLRVDIFLCWEAFIRPRHYSPILQRPDCCRSKSLVDVLLGPSLQLLVAQTLLGETIDAVTLRRWVGVGGSATRIRAGTFSCSVVHFEGVKD